MERSEGGGTLSSFSISTFQLGLDKSIKADLEWKST